MPIRSRFPLRDTLGGEAPGSADAPEVEQAIEHIRQGTVERYESAWTLVPASAAVEFRHNLGDMPWVVDVVYSDTSEGKYPRDASSLVTVTKADKDSSAGSGDTTLTVTAASATENYYYKVRAL